MGNSTELNQPKYFEDLLASKWKAGYILCWRRGFDFVSTGEEMLRIPSKLIRMRFEQERPLIRKVHQPV